MTYRGHQARIVYDPSDRIFVAHIDGVTAISGFHGQSVAELEAAFHEAVVDYVATCARANKAPEKPFSGRVMLRIAPATHVRAALAAQIKGISLNQWAKEALSTQAEADLMVAVAPKP